MRDLRIRCHPSCAVRLHAALIEPPRVSVYPRPDSREVVELPNELVYPFHRLLKYALTVSVHTLPVEYGDAIMQVTQNVAVEECGFGKRVAAAGEVVEAAQKVGALRLLVVPIAIGVHVGCSLGRFDDNTLNGVRYSHQVQVGLVAALCR